MCILLSEMTDNGVALNIVGPDNNNNSYYPMLFVVPVQVNRKNLVT